MSWAVCVCVYVFSTGGGTLPVRPQVLIRAQIGLVLLSLCPLNVPSALLSVCVRDDEA